MNYLTIGSIFRNIPRKIIALIIGYHIWLILGSWIPAYRWIEAPLCFYNTAENIQLNAPESVLIAVAGQRTTLANLDTCALAVHIDTHTLVDGNNALILSDHQLLLPPHIHVVDWSPSNVAIHKQTILDMQG